MTHERIISKIQRLLELSKSNNPNEAASAAAQAQRLMDEYRVTSVELSSADNKMVKLHRMHGKMAGNRSTWREHLAVVVASHNGVCASIAHGMILITGREDDVRITQCLFDYCSAEIDKLTKTHCVGQGKRYANSFRIGCVYTIANKLKQDRAATDVGQLAIVFVDKRLDEARALLNNKPATVSKTTMDDMAIIHGMAAGSQIQLPDNTKLTE